MRTILRRVETPMVEKPRLPALLLSGLLLLALLGEARANECTEARDITKATVAPCSGVLLPESIARECVRLKVSLVPRLQLRILELEKRAAIDAQAAAEQRQACEQECADLRSTIADLTVLERGPNPITVGVLSALGAALVVGVAWAIVEATR